MKKIIVVLMFLGLASPAYAAIPFSCFGKKGLEKEECECSKKTGVTAELCKQSLDLKVEQKKRELEVQQNRLNNSGVGAGSGNTNVILGGLGMGGGASGGQNLDDLGQSLVGIKSKHYVAIGLAGYILPAEPGYSRQMPERFIPNEFTYEYYINSSWSAGVMWQDFSIAGKSFNTITEPTTVTEEVTVTDPDTGETTTGTREIVTNTVVYAPGSDRMQLLRIWMLMSFHINIQEDWEITATAGQAIMYEAKLYTDGQHTSTVVPGKPFLAAAGVGYKPIGKDYMGMLGFRFVEAQVDTNDYFGYHSPGGAEIFLGAKFGVF